MDRNILFVALFLIVIVVVVVYVTQQGWLGKQAGSTTYYVINYGTGDNSSVGVAQLQSDGSYKLANGSIIPSAQVTKVTDKYEGTTNLYCCPSNCPLTYDPVCGVDGYTYVNVCGAALANIKVAYQGVCGQQTTGECDQPCIEPKPELRFVCQNGQIVSNRVDCQGNESCAYAVSKYFICPDGTTTSDSQSCNVSQYATTAYTGIKTIYKCSDGTEATSEADCSANCVQTTSTVTHATSNYGYGGVSSVIYECWDGSYVKSPKDCKPYCNQSCTCGDEADPVCANGSTYRNPCLARCDGLTSYTEGRCGQQTCASSGARCTPSSTVGAGTLTHLSAFNFPSCCENGTYCSANGVCVPNAQCKKTGDSCTRANVTYTTAYVPNMQSDCCQGMFCDENSVCSNRTACGTSNSQCGTYTYTTGNSQQKVYLGACCDGFTCTNNQCVINQCGEEYSSCKGDSDCCSGMECSSYGQCKKPCTNESGTCKSSTECCGDLVCTNYKCAKNTTTTGTLCSGVINGSEWYNKTSCATGYYQGSWGTYCGYCKDRYEYRYYCKLNYTYTAAGAPSSTLTDQVDLSSLQCKQSCTGTLCTEYSK